MAVQAETADVTIAGVGDALIRIDPRKALRIQLLAALSRSRFYRSPDDLCDCNEGRARREQNWTCHRCGYVGRMLIQRCICEVTHERVVSTLRARLVQAREGRAVGRGRRREDPAMLEQELALQEALTVRRCRITKPKDGCPHGKPLCPSCTSVSDDHVRTIREVRKVLAEWSLI